MRNIALILLINKTSKIRIIKPLAYIQKKVTIRPTVKQKLKTYRLVCFYKICLYI